jgi:hypothetical protein
LIHQQGTPTKGKIMNDFIPTTATEQSWPTAADLVAAVKAMAMEDIAAGEPAGELDGYLDAADDLFPDAPQGIDASKADAALTAYHARAVSIMTKARAGLEGWLQTLVDSSHE